MNFSPTTTYESAFENMILALLHVGAFTPLVGLLLVFIFIIPNRRALDTSIKKKAAGAVAGLFVVVALGSTVTGISLTNTDRYDAIRAEKSANLVTNLKTKYEIKDASFDKDEYSKLRIMNGGALPPQPHMHDEQIIIVTLENEEKAVFRLSQDENTSEPTLTELLPGATVVSLESISRS